MLLYCEGWQRSKMQHLQRVKTSVLILAVCGLKRKKFGQNVGDRLQFSPAFLLERDFVTFGSLLIVIANPSVCRLSVTFVHPTQEVEAFGNISSLPCTLHDT